MRLRNGPVPEAVGIEDAEREQEWTKRVVAALLPLRQPPVLDEVGEEAMRRRRTQVGGVPDLVEGERRRP
jgi:hypothetical protein